MYSGGAARRKQGGGNMSPEHYMNTAAKGFLDLLITIGYKYFIIPPKGCYLTILVPDAKLLKELKAMIESNDHEQERRAYQILDLLFVPHNLANYSKLTTSLKDNMLELTNRHSDKFVITSVDATKHKLLVSGAGDKMATLQPMAFNPVNENDRAIVFMSLSDAFPRIYPDKIKGGAKFEKFVPTTPNVTGGCQKNSQQDEERYIKYLHLLYNTPLCGCMLPAYAGNSSVWNMQWDYLPENTRHAISAVTYSPEFEQLVRTDKLPHNPLLIKYLTHNISHGAPMQLISQIVDGVLKCAPDCSKKSCQQCFKIHTCGDNVQCPMRGINVTDLIRMLSVRGLVGHMHQLGLPSDNIVSLVDEQPVAALTNMAAATFADRGNIIMQYRGQLATLVYAMRQAMGDEYTDSILREVMKPTTSGPAGSQFVVPGQFVIPVAMPAPPMQSGPRRIGNAREYHTPHMM